MCFPLAQLKKTVEDLNDALATKEEIAQRCHELDMQVRTRLEAHVSGAYYRNIRLDLILMIPGRLTLVMERGHTIRCDHP